MTNKQERFLLTEEQLMQFARLYIERENIRLSAAPAGAYWAADKRLNAFKAKLKVKK